MSVDNRANELEILDKERLVMLFGDSRELLEEIYQIVQSDFPELSHKLETAVKQQNYEDISQYAHTLKGSIANVGGVKSSQTAHKINLAAKEENGESCMELYKDFTTELDAFINALRKYSHGEK